ncbi:hypothetical protein CFB82_23410 [Burkholderia sp. HI2714]|nr:hypothetical protein CFB82_23410 [Burkholderia sp. HI2714]
MCHTPRLTSLHGVRRAGDAAREYLAVLANEPDHPQSLHLYGVPQFRRGAADQAEALLDQSIAIAPDGCTLSDPGVRSSCARGSARTAPLPASNLRHLTIPTRTRRCGNCSRPAR